jgi:predicted permease
MGISIVAGRDFEPSDTREAAGVVMVNETLARQHWPGDNPLGRRLKMGRGDEPWLTVVGVVRDIRHLGPATPPRPELYQPHSQRSFPFMAFVVRTTVPPRSVVPALRSAVAALDSTQPISGVSTMDDHIARALARPRILSVLVALFGALALVLALVGIYGVMAYAVAQRTQEIAIRAALGASASEVVRLVLTKAAWLAGGGVACGLALTALATRGLAGLLFEVTPTDPGTYAAVITLLVSVALLAAAIPAFRAARIDGARALRA